jgi:hypothetical protein
MAELSDSDLMVRFQQGNPHAFALLFEMYRGPVFNFIYRMLNGRRADDDGACRPVVFLTERESSIAQENRIMR